MRTHDQRGFTLIEMLIVCLTIAALAAIALPAFLSQNQKAKDSHAKGHASTAAKTLEVLRNEAGTYAVPAATVASYEPSLQSALNLTVAGDRDSFLISVDSGSGVRYELAGGAGGAHRTCAPAGQGGCAKTPDADGNSW